MVTKKLSKSDKIRKLLDKGVDRNQIVKDLSVSPQLVYIVAKKGGFVKKKAKKAVYKSPRSRLVKDIFKMKKALDVVEAVKTEPLRLDSNGNLRFGSTPIDPVNHPPHYTEGGFETIDFIEAKDLNYRLGNVVKYVSRAGRKLDANPVEDLEKAAWYLNREIEARRNA